MIDITEINVSTGEVIEREYTKKEKDERVALQSNPPQEIIDMRSQDQSLENQEFIAFATYSLVLEKFRPSLSRMGINGRCKFHYKTND